LGSVAQSTAAVHQVILVTAVIAVDHLIAMVHVVQATAEHQQDHQSVEQSVVQPMLAFQEVQLTLSSLLLP
jgi:hypothetical protein